MLTIFIRTLIVYTLLIISMRIMGKRQIGELEVSDLVTTLMLSEIATLPIENPDIPVINAIIPIVILLFIEVFSSVVLIKIPLLKNIVSARPSILIRNGRIDQKELKNNRISLEELMSELRAAQCTDPREIEYAILEKNGKLSVIPKKKDSPPSASDLGISTQESGMVHLLIIDGKICKNNLEASGKSLAWLNSQIKKISTPMSSIYYFAVDDAERITVVRKEK